MPHAIRCQTSLGDIHTEKDRFDNRDKWNTAQMEAIAAGGSVIAFIQITARISAAIIDIGQRFHDAPAEFKQMNRQLNLLQAELNLVQNLRGTANDDDLALLPDEIESLGTALKEAEFVILDVQRVCKKLTLDVNPRTRVRLCWALYDQSKFKTVRSRLQDIQMSLQTILLLVNVRITNLSRKALGASLSLSASSNSSLMEVVAAMLKIVEEHSQEIKAQGNIARNGLLTRNPHLGNQFLKSMVHLERSWLRFLGIEAVLSTYGNDYQTTYNLSGRYRLHRLLGLRLICLDLRLRYFPIAGLGLQFVAGSLSVKNVVPENSAIMTACKKGDTAVVQELFRSRQASPNDVTPENSSPLRYAIESGSVELVQVILASGADVNAPFGQFMTSPLEWAFASRKIDVARLFIANGARLDHISAKGWTPAFNLFGYKWIHGMDGPCREYLELLSSRDFTEFDVRDSDGWSAMHRAAAYGTSDDVAALKERGSPVGLLTRMNWTPIRCSVRFENADTFLELVKYLPSSFINEKDIRGWTLLHEAASMGSSKMLELILLHEADPHAVSNATSWMVPAGLEDRAVTPADVAKNEGDDAYETYVQILSKAGHDVTICKEVDGDDADGLFWPAVE